MKAMLAFLALPATGFIAHCFAQQIAAAKCSAGLHRFPAGPKKIESAN